MITTLNKIRAQSPCASRWAKLLGNLGKTKADDEPLRIAVVLESNGLDDALWCLRAVDGHQREMRLFAVDCARTVQHLMIDQRSLDALDTAERHADGLVTDRELADAWAAAWAADGAAARAAAWAAAWAADGAADGAAARAAAMAAARATAWEAAMAAADTTAWEAAMAAADTTVQSNMLALMCAEIELELEQFGETK